MEKFILIPVPLDDFKEEITEIVRQQLISFFESNRKSDEKIELITRKEAVKFLGVSLPTLHDWTKSGIVKGYRIGACVRFKKSELEQSLTQMFGQVFEHKRKRG